MKTIEDMNQTQLMNFNSEVVDYVNENFSFVIETHRNLERTMTPAKLAQTFIEHYNETIDAYGQDDAVLSEEQRKQFLYVAETLFTDGFYPHAGSFYHEDEVEFGIAKSDEELKSFVSEQYEANLFEGCETREDVESVINDCDIEFTDEEKSAVIDYAYNYINERR